MGAEIHIASCVAYARPEAVDRVREAIREGTDAEVPRHDAHGRLVVLIESDSAAAVLATIDRIRALEGVLAVHLAYQHAEPASELESE